MALLPRGLIIALIVVVLSECQPFHALENPHGTMRVSLGTRPAPAVAPLDLMELPDTIRIEYQDRINRFRLAAQGVAPPSIDELQVAAGQIPGIPFPVPVIRLIFSEKVFFDFDRAEVKPEALPLLTLVAENMRRDLPDTQILILGHTDAIGSDKHNDELSQRRAQSVMTELIRRGVGSANMATVALGKRQPVAPNDTKIGRAQNRRVEFMISAYQDANTRLIEKRRVNEDWLTTVRSEPAPSPVQPERLQVLKPEARAAPSPPEATAPSSIVTASRVFAGPTQYPPKEFAAYGIVAFRSRRSPYDRDRHLMICNEYVATLPHASELGIPRAEQLVTVWPLNSDDYSNRLNQLLDNIKDICQIAVDNYGLVVAQRALKDAELAGVNTIGTGLFLLAWSPSTNKGKHNVLVLVSDLSNVTTSEQAYEIFIAWSRDIERDPALWSNGWDIERLRSKIRYWVDKYGSKSLAVFWSGGEISCWKP